MVLRSGIDHNVPTDVSLTSSGIVRVGFRKASESFMDCVMYDILRSCCPMIASIILIDCELTPLFSLVVGTAMITFHVGADHNTGEENNAGQRG